MREGKSYILIASAGLMMLIIILDGKTALYGASVGIELCMRTVIPALFPFFILSGIIGNALIGQKINFLRPIGKHCKIPQGAESILIFGFLAGYPVGAQLVAQAYRDGKLSEATAKRMICFCNNAGPSFIFGLVSTMFTEISTAWVLWGIHIISGLLVGYILPTGQMTSCSLRKKEAPTLPKAMEKAIKTIASVCGWVVIFRILLEFCNRWFLWRLPVAFQVLFSGLLELSNGCVRLSEIPSEGLRFVLTGALLSAGGLCVTMQTVSVSQNVFSTTYFLGKGMQTVFSAFLCFLFQPLLFAESERTHATIWVVILVCIAAILPVFCRRGKKDVAIRKDLMYNTKKI